MNKPTPAARQALADLCETRPMQDFMAWVQSERDRFDKENRIRGKENNITAAYALTVLIDAFEAARATKSPGHTM